MSLLVLMFIVMFSVKFLPIYIKYRKSNYFMASGITFSNVIFDKGNYGEFLTFICLEKLKGHHRIMTNLYIPKEDGTTTEIDVLMVSETGIYAFESKNYSGWIFGDEKNKNWTQSLPNRRKNKFYNPIWQNKGHISALKYALGLDVDMIYKSYIVFSERCTLKKITVRSENTKVIKRNALYRTIGGDINKLDKVLNERGVEKVYNMLSKYACADKETKNVHVENIKRKIAN